MLELDPAADSAPALRARVLLAQGDARVKGESALVAMPAKTIVFSEEGEARELREGDQGEQGERRDHLRAGLRGQGERQRPGPVLADG